MNIRAVRSGNYLCMNSAALDDPRLGFRAKGILAYLLAKPDGWRANLKDLQRRSTDGRDAIRSAINQLKRLGYAQTQAIRNRKTGLMEGKEMIVYETPINGFPVLRSSRTSEMPTYSNNQGSNKQNIPASSRVVSPSFDLMADRREITTEYSPSVTLFASFSKKMGYHIIKKDAKKNIYVNGGKEGGWHRQTLQDWQKYHDALAEEVSPERIEKILRWYIKNQSYRFLPVVHTFAVFCQKFRAIEQTRKRKMEDEGQEAEPAKARISIKIRPDSRNGK